MIIITHRRKKCIGCNACVEIAPDRWQISKKDGKAILLHGKQKKEYTILHVSEIEEDKALSVEAACPAKIISVKRL